ncbi:uncharacterized protein LOC135704346 [Ochlerotatus camptorhynchus]|uniref:uncharacterized protein LOC135704346 n=1 Tax=Ochlerotatus camptorhynchus TaxID=644619 RepID=UPI0031CE5D70
MEMKEEILKRLSNAGEDFESNLAYGIKLWKSNSFYYMSKYEVIFEFCLDQVGDFLEGLSGLSSAEFDEKWQIVNEFLALPCPSNALPPRLIPKLRSVLTELRTKQGDAISKALLESCLIVAFDVKYKNFYKFDYESYGKTLNLALDCYQMYLKMHFVKEEEEETIKRILDDIRIYVKSAGDDGKWKKAFTFALTNLCQVILALKAHRLDRHEELLELLRDVYFQDGKSSNFNRVLDQSKKRLLMSYFDPSTLPIHVVALLIEGYLRAYREIKLDVLLFLKYILLYVFVDPEKSILSDVHQIFQLTDYVFYLLKKYFIKIDQKLVQDFDFTGIFTVKLKEFLEKYESSEEHLRDIFSLICTINEYNPLILETSIIDIILRTMFITKGPKTVEKFQAMLISTVGLYVKLNRSENFREELFMKLGDYLDDHDLGERLKELRKVSNKRKSLAAVNETSGKRRKLDDGEEVIQKDSTDEECYLRLLYPSQTENAAKKVFRLQLQDQWQSIAFAWPDSNGHLNQAMMDYVKGLLTKRSFTYWRKMQDYLEELLATLSEEQSETELFKLEFATCWMCYFFAGNTLIEQTNLFWEKLGKQFIEFDELMASFGRMLLDGSTRDGRVFDSFLKLVYFYGNYRLVVHYYRPDSIEDSQNDHIHRFLSDEEWKQFEELVPSSGLAFLNRIHLQRIRVSQLNAESGEELEHHSELVEKILAPEGSDQLRWLLLDRSTNCWFLQLLSLEQKVSVVDRLLNDNCYAEIEHVVEQLADDHVLMEVVVLSTYKKIAETVFGQCKSSVTRKLSFDGIYEFDEDGTMGRIRKLLEKKAEKKDAVVAVSNVDQLRDLLKILSEIRIDEIAETEKTIIVAVGILVFTDVMTCGEPDLITLHGNIINKQLTFGMVPNLLKFLDIDTLIRIFGQSSPVMVAFIRQTAAYLTEEAFASIQAMLENFLQQSDERFELILSIFFYLQKSNANRRKLIPAEQLSELIAQYVSAIEAFIASKTAKKVRKSDLDMFNNLLKGCSLIIHYKAVCKKELSDDLREVLLQYIDQALKVDSLSSSTLLTNALQHKAFLKLDPERIDLVVENRWSGFLTQLRNECQNGADCTSANDSDVDSLHMQSKNVKVFAAFLTHHQTAKKLTVRFNQLEKEAASDRSYRTKQFVLRVYAVFAKNAFGSGVSQDVEKAFVRSFGTVVADEIVPLCVMKKLFDDRICLEEILSCLSAVVSNPKLTLVPSIMDNMLEFLSCINIKKCAVKDGEEKVFYQLHRLISDVLYLMMIIRPNYVANRLPQYFYVYNGLIASIISYKEDRPLEKPLNSFEILTLSDLLLPLEKIMSHAGQKVAKDLRIMAPYVLAQIIHFIIQSKRSTTLHEKISRTVYNICYGLIEIYDKHSSSYLLRTCDEASKNVYTEIVKGFRKYRSFKGKI